MQTHTSTFQSRLAALGPGVLMATAAVGGSHLIASTQAGALYGWQLAIIIILANVFKYPFFRFGFQYTLDTGKTLLEGYAEKSTIFLWVFFLLNIFTALVNSAAVALIAAVILQTMLPFALSIEVLAALVMSITALLLVAGKYHLLDRLSKLIMVVLSITTIAAVIIAVFKTSSPMVETASMVQASPWNLAALAFIVTLMGWMPAPIEFSVISSLWLKAKRKDQIEHHEQSFSKEDSLWDFNIGYISTAVLALFFLAIGALVQYGSGEAVERVGGAYIRQLIDMYAVTIGEWSRLLVSFIAFACMFGTTLTVVDGYARTLSDSIELIVAKRTHNNRRLLTLMIIILAVLGFVVVMFFKGALGPMLSFAMISSFIATPIFAWLNFSLVNHDGKKLASWLSLLSWIGLVYLSLFTLMFLLQKVGFLN